MQLMDTDRKVNQNGFAAGHAAAELGKRLADDGTLLLRLLAQDPSVMTWTIGVDMRIGFASEAAAESLANRKPEDLVGRSLHDLAPAAAAERIARLVKRALDEDATVVGRGVWRGRRMRSVFTPVAVREGGREVLVLTRPSPLGLDEADDGAVDEAEYAEFGVLDVLTPRELEVLGYFGQGLPPREIADRLHRSVKTVQRFREELSRKIGIGDRCRLGAIARDAGLLPEHARLKRVRWRPSE